MQPQIEDEPLHTGLKKLNPDAPTYAVEFVDLLLAAAKACGASDVHLQPAESQLEVAWRLDGVLQTLGSFPPGTTTGVISRLKVMAGLLTYRSDTPQEGRIRSEVSHVEMRVSTFPVLHGERAVVRLFAAAQKFDRLDDLGLPTAIRDTFRQLLAGVSGALLITGPAGSGKTTTAYACLRELAEGEIRKSIVSLEDPIEVAVPGVAQAQVNASSGFTLESGLRSLMRQDPEVILVGEVRDPGTAEAAFQASLTGHLVVTTIHAGSAAEAISRLSDMGIEPYLLRSGLLAILCQRLVRCLCSCAAPCTSADEFLQLEVGSAMRPVGCHLCRQTGYSGRALIVEMLTPTPQVATAILNREDSHEIERIALQGGMVSRWTRVKQAVEGGLTSPAEIRRAFGFSR